MSDAASSYLDSLSTKSDEIGEEEKTGKIFTWSTLLRDHTRFISILPNYLFAYILPGYKLNPTVIEKIMLTVNSYNTCPYCTGLHGELARMSGLDGDTIDNNNISSTSDDDDNDKDEDKDANVSEEVKYAQTFAIESGRGNAVKFAYDNMLNTIGMKHAKSVRALCWALLWGKTTGNTINTARDKILKGGKDKKEKVTSLDVFMLIYYGPLFSIIGVLNKILIGMPSSVPKVISSVIGAVLWLPQAINITPLGIVSLVLNKGVV